MNEYYESILLELEQRSAVERSMFEHADCEFEDGVLNLKLQNSIVAEGKKDSIVNLLLEVFNNRFHVPLSVKVGYLPPKRRARWNLTIFCFRQKWMRSLSGMKRSEKRNRRKPGNQRMVEMILERRSLRLFRRCRKRSGLEKR